MRLKQKWDGVCVEVGIEWTNTTGGAAGTSCWQHQIQFSANVGKNVTDNQLHAFCPVPAVTGGAAGTTCWQHEMHFAAVVERCYRQSNARLLPCPCFYRKCSGRWLLATTSWPWRRASRPTGSRMHCSSPTSSTGVWASVRAHRVCGM